MQVESQTSSSYLKQRPKIQTTDSCCVGERDVRVSSVPAKHDTARSPVSLHTNKHHFLALYSKHAGSGFLRSTASWLHTSSSHSGNNCYSHVTNIINKKTFFFPITFLLPSSWYDVTRHKDITTSIHIQNLCTVQLKTNIGISTRFHTALFRV